MQWSANFVKPRFTACNFTKIEFEMVVFMVIFQEFPEEEGYFFIIIGTKIM